MNTPEHHHPNDGNFRQDCARCRMEYAAPELFAACESALGWLGFSEVQYLIGHKLGEQAALQRTLTQLRQAIHKARRGDSPQRKGT
jgi:hypothetical protein